MLAMCRMSVRKEILSHVKLGFFKWVQFGAGGHTTDVQEEGGFVDCIFFPHDNRFH